MRYTGESCPYCKVEFTEQDDVVVCPDCGTPHHRVCWFAHGECAAADKHGEGYVWQKSAEPEQPQETKSEEKTHAHNESNLDIICPDCGEIVEVFTRKGRIVHLDTLLQDAVKKAQAIIAVLRHDRHALLVTDEGAAREMLRILNP